MMGALAAFERGLIAERTKAEMKAAERGGTPEPDIPSAGLRASIGV
ncbi:MAG: recombinase family protein [Acidobacteria bacterium]|nr:recombinase family protein [Acidobacteriota bacterium]